MFTEFLWLEDKTFRISTTNSAIITDSILQDIQIRTDQQGGLRPTNNFSVNRRRLEHLRLKSITESSIVDCLSAQWVFTVNCDIFLLERGRGCSYILSELQSSISIINVNNVTVVSSHRTQNTAEDGARWEQKLVDHPVNTVTYGQRRKYLANWNKKIFWSVTL